MDLARLGYRRWKKEMTVLAFKDSKTIDIGGIDLSYTDIGGGPVVLFSHASASGCDIGPIAFQWLAERGYRILTPSRSGYPGAPIALGGSPEQQADIYSLFLDALNIKKASVLAWSGGGPSAICFAIQHPERCAGLISYCCSTVKWEQKVAPMERVFMSDIGMWLMYSYMTMRPRSALKAGAKAMGLDPEIVLNNENKLDQLIRFQMALTPYSIRKEGVLSDFRENRKMARYQVERICCPTLAIHAENDPELPICNAEFLADNVPGAVFLRLKRGGHHPLIDSEGEKVSDSIISHLSRCTGPT